MNRLFDSFEFFVKSIVSIRFPLTFGCVRLLNLRTLDPLGPRDRSTCRVVNSESVPSTPGATPKGGASKEEGTHIISPEEREVRSVRRARLLATPAPLMGIIGNTLLVFLECSSPSRKRKHTLRK